MTVAEYVVDQLEKQRVTDAFGIPGGVVLPLLYAMNNNPLVEAHLTYNEQMAGFAACGYAQSEGRIGVAYATRGPGITNMITCMVEAYQESIPVLFITAHGDRSELGLRVESNQEIDLVETTSRFTKFSANINDVDSVDKSLKTAFKLMLSGRKGPAFLDFSAGIWNKEMKCEQEVSIFVSNSKVTDDVEMVVDCILNELSKAKRPVILIGDGIRQSGCIELAQDVLSKFHIPIISSRGAQDLFAFSDLYYGYVGSHGNRYANFILSKTDLIISIGNSLSFPINSDSFRSIFEHTKIIRIDIDQGEFKRELPNSVNYNIDIRCMLNVLKNSVYEMKRDALWINVCNILKESLEKEDISETVEKISKLLKVNHSEMEFVCDVGNNEFWFSRAYEYVRPRGNILYSKTYGTLGSSLGRAIGVYFATRKNVVCVVGDQGFQTNIQELQFISMWKIPIKIVLINNRCSGMIRDQEERKYVKKYIHIDSNTGYGAPKFCDIIGAYDMEYRDFDSCRERELFELLELNIPVVIEIKIRNDVSLIPHLPKGNDCQKMEPMIKNDLYNYLNSL